MKHGPTYHVLAPRPALSKLEDHRIRDATKHATGQNGWARFREESAVLVAHDPAGQPIEASRDLVGSEFRSISQRFIPPAR